MRDGLRWRGCWVAGAGSPEPGAQQDQKSSGSSKYRIASHQGGKSKRQKARTNSTVECAYRYRNEQNRPAVVPPCSQLSYTEQQQCAHTYRQHRDSVPHNRGG